MKGRVTRRPRTAPAATTVPAADMLLHLQERLDDAYKAIGAAGDAPFQALFDEFFAKNPAAVTACVEWDADEDAPRLAVEFTYKAPGELDATYRFNNYEIEIDVDGDYDYYDSGADAPDPALDAVVDPIAKFSDHIKGHLCDVFQFRIGRLGRLFAQPGRPVEFE